VKEIRIESRERAEPIKLDGQVAQAIEESGVKCGVCHVFVAYTTAGVTINERAAVRPVAQPRQQQQLR
jgi:thiamine phosphate synthase YjbQ (UPF0047 family)